ncbi:hypothetical protein OAB01_01255 [Bacteroidia bacterium]|nr:hypothetical protein [Bacteroidia bacterium]
MVDEVYEEVPEEFSIGQVRPRFKMDLNYSPEALVKKFTVALSEDNKPCQGQANETYATLYFPRDKRHYWSPQLTLMIEGNEEDGTHLRGLYGPRPAVWTMFVFFYSIIAVITLFCVMIGGSQLMLGKSSWVLWLIPFLVILFASLYYVAHLGKKKGKPEIEVMHQFLLKILIE